MKIRMWVAGSNFHQRGFTLLELIPVLLIATSLVGIVAPKIANLLPGVELKSFTQRYAASLRQANSRAVAGGSTVHVTYELQSSSIIISDSDKRLQLPDGARLMHSNTINPLSMLPASGTENSLSFYPDGSSSGANLSISSDAGHYQIQVNWLNSRVSINE